MDEIIVFLGIFIFLILLGVGGFLIWYFLFRKKSSTGNGNGDNGNSESSEKKTNGNGGFNPNKTNGGKGLKPKTKKPTHNSKVPFSITNVNYNGKHKDTNNGSPFSITLDPKNPGTSGTDKIALLLNEKTSCQNYHFRWGDFITSKFGIYIPHALIWQGAKDTILCRDTFGMINTQFAVLRPFSGKNSFSSRDLPNTNCQWEFNEIPNSNSNSDKVTRVTICNPTAKPSDQKWCLRTCTECTYPKMRIDPFKEDDTTFHFEIINPGVENNNPSGVVCKS